jgi:uncharacterized membrane protein
MLAPQFYRVAYSRSGLAFSEGVTRSCHNSKEAVRNKPAREKLVTTPIIMLVLMTAPCIVSRIVSAVTGRVFNVRGAAAIGLGILFIFTGIGHFIQTEPMAQMLPPWVPERTLLVYLTGGLEFAIAVGFLAPKSRRFTGWVAAIVLVLFFPANIYAAINHIPMGGHAWGPVYLLIRAPLQIIILFWVYWFTIRRPNTSLNTDAR